MKYAFRFLALMAAASIVFFSCEKENATDVEENVPGTTGPAAQEETNPGENPQFDPDECLLSFGASLEKTRVDINFSTGDLTFEGGDEALVYNGTASAVYVYDKEGDVFNVKDGESPVKLSAGVQVFYPAGEFSISDSNVIFTMPAAVTGADDSERADDLGAKLPLAGKVTGSSGEWSVTFKSVGSILKVGVTGARTLNSLTLSNTALDLGEGAEFTIGWSDGDDPNPTMATTGSEKTSIAITGLSQDLGSTAVTYYFLLPAGVAYEGLKVTAGLDSEDQGGLTTYDIVRGNTTAIRNKVVKMSFYAGLFSGGTGSNENDPYFIASARDFKHISEYCTNGYGSLDAAHFLGAFYKQAADINFIKANLSKTDLSDYMIGGASTPFKGTYDGDDKILSNFTISGTPSGNEGVAPFKAVDGAVLQNISISDATISGGKFTAGLVGYATGTGLTIRNCSISSSDISGIGDYGAAGLIGGLYVGTVSSCSGTDLTIGATADSDGKKRYYGGLISYARGATTVSRCSLNGTTTVNGTPAYFGGIVGQTNSENTVTISECQNHSGISGVGNFAGGIVGLKNVGSVEGCSNDGSVGGAQYVGGIVARNAGGSVIGCTNEGAIVSAGGYAGGIAGDVTGGTIMDCTNESTVTFSVSGATVGGIAGALTGGTITASDGKYTENKADINLGVDEGKNNVGGIVGQLEGAITNVKNSGAITGYYNIGGIGGTITTNGSVENALSSGDVSGYQNVGGISGKHGHNQNATITKKISLKNCHVDGADITASANDGRAGGIAGLVFAGSWIEGCTAFRGTVSGHQDVGGAIGNLQYASSSTDKSNRIFVGANLVSMDVSGLTPISNTSRIGGFFGYFQNNKDAYTFAYQNGVVGGSVTAEGCQYVGSFVGYASVSSNKGRIWDSYSLIEDANFHVTTTNAHIGGFAGEYGNSNVNSVRNAHVNSQNTSTSTAGITKTTVADIRTVNLGTTETPTANVNGSAYTTTTWSNPDDVNYPVPTILVTYGHYK